MREIAVALLLAWSSPAAAQSAHPAESADCTAAIATAERSGGIPVGLLAAIGQIESGRPDPMYGTVQPGPWTINAGGAGHFFATKTDAVAATAALLSRGVVSVDVGCLQVNLAYHPAAFASLEEAFDPLANALYATQYLRLLFSQTGDWPAAVGAYHSQTHQIGAAYQGRVLAVWTPPGSAAPPPVDTRPPGFDPTHWVGAGRRDGWWAVLDSKPSAFRPLTSVESPRWIERVIAIVASCAMPTGTQAQARTAPGEVAPAPSLRLPGLPAREWEGTTGGRCPGSPFAKPAALRQLLAGP
jgi:Transglycosylase SLT domain